MRIKKHIATLEKASKPVVEGLEDRRLMSTYTVTNTNDAGSGSLRQAILDSNNHSGADTIRFAIGSGAKTIKLSTKLPAISDACNLDATTQPGFNGKPLIEINGQNTGNSDGIKLTGTNITVRGLIINRFGGSGVFIYSKGGNKIVGCYIGTDSNGSAALGNKAHGIIVQAPNNTIGGTTAADRNIISANGTGVFLYTNVAKNNIVRGNFIGTDANGTKDVGNKSCGVQFEQAGSNTVRNNVISGNDRDGVLVHGSGSSNNTVQDNLIGTDKSGTKDLGNSWYGVEVSRPGNNIIGNVVSGNGESGIVLYLGTAYHNIVQDNYVGTDITGTKDLGNDGRGIEMTNGAIANKVDGNVISGNSGGGIGIYSGSKKNLITGNLIGTTASGKEKLGNGYAGIMITDGAGENWIGAKGDGNVISNNNQGIVLSSGTQGTLIQGNHIGTDITGTKDFGNATDGIYVGSSKNQIGGKTKGTGNIIAGNGGDGIRVNNSSNNNIRRNTIGRGKDGKSLPNGKSGIVMNNTSNTPIRGNAVANNGAGGVKITGGSNNKVQYNAIYANKDFDIKGTGTAKVTLTSVKLQGGKYKISGSVTAGANSSTYVELFLNNRTPLGHASVTTSGSGKVNFSLVVDDLPDGGKLTATATTSNGATSSYSGILTV